MNAFDESEVDELMADIVADHPAGHFAEVMPALRRFCELSVAQRDAWAALPDLAKDLRGYVAAHEAICAGTQERIGLADLLQLWPGQRGLPPVRRQ